MNVIAERGTRPWDISTSALPNSVRVLTALYVAVPIIVEAVPSYLLQKTRI